MKTRAILFVALLVAAPAGAQRGVAPLQHELSRIAAAAPGTVGIAAINLRTGERASVRGDDAFAMASVYKFPIAIRILRRIERSELSLDSVVRVTPLDLRGGASPLVTNPRPVRVGELLRLMVSESDNTASDILLRLAGGAPAVTAELGRAGITGIRVDRDEAMLAADYHGVRWTRPRSPNRAELDSALRTVPAATRRAAARRFPADPRDRATPVAMAELLARFETGRVLGAPSTRSLREMMVKTPTGLARLRGRLPAGTVVAHKTGTAASYGNVTAAVNDAGIITLPNGDRVAVVVFIRDARGPLPTAERTIADVARAVYDHWK
ncbi:MAG TPA: class A beta-lactamase [Longimicrobium sp.]|nr:class A beta-lactamase [Longimicrobium sp.]